MNPSIRPAAPQLEDLQPYDPKYLPADVMLSANENTADVPPEIRRQIEHEVRKVALNRYPDPLANDLRDMIAEANGLDRDQVLLGNGGDELLFDIALAWGGPGRTYLDMPPTFSVYRSNALLTNTAVQEIPRQIDFSLSGEACQRRLEQGDIDYTIITSPNNPSGNLADPLWVERLAEASDALVVVDEAYFEFSRNTVRPLLDRYPNLCILRTFSKAFSLAGVRIGYLLGHEDVLTQLKKVRQPYSVNAVSQAVARVVYGNRAAFEKGIDAILAERERLLGALDALAGVSAYPSDSNFILFALDDAYDGGAVWQRLLDAGVLVRDFSQAPYLHNCLRVSVGNEYENDCFLEALEAALA